MAEAKGTNSKAGSGVAPADAGRVRFKNIWPIPALGLGGALLVGGLVVAFMGRPKPPADIPLEEAKALVQEKRYQEAIEKLNSKEVRNYLDYGSPDADHMRAFHLARARAFAGAQATLGLNRAENHRVIVEDFEAAEKGEAGAGHELEPVDVSLLVESKIALDDVDGALKRIGALGESEPARKTRLTRMVVDHNLAMLTATDTPEQARSEQTLSLLAALSADPSLSPGDRAWVLARQGDLLLASKQPEEAINKLIRRVGLLKDVPLEQQGELYVLLGKAYFQSDQPVEAAKQLEAADSLLERSSPLRADLGIMQARLAQSGVAVGAAGAEGDPSLLLEFAREKYEGVMTEFGPGPQYAKALLGVAEVEASLRHDEKSLEKYAELVSLLNGGARPSVAAPEHAEAKVAAPEAGKAEGEHAAEGAKPETHASEHTEAKAPDAPKEGEPAHKAEAAKAKEVTKPHHLAGVGEAGRVSRLGGLTRERVLASLMQRFRERFDSEQRESALRYASIAETLYKDAETPGEVLDAIGKTRRAMGDQLMDQAREAHAAAAAKGAVTPEFRVVDLDPATRAEVKKNYIVAGDYLRRHSKVISATDLGEASKSLWLAADSYDRAGDMDEAKKAFADYAAGASDTDPHKAEAKFRLAQVFQAKNPPEYGAAVALYRELAQSVDLHDPTRSAGSIADRAVVPLAQCMLNDNDPANDDEAHRLLIGVVDGSRLAPEASEFRDALVELGRAAYKGERFAEAIGWFEQAVKRTKEARQAVELRYLLADSHRREGVKIGKTLATQKLPQAQVDQLEAARQDHLSSARGMYDEVRSDLDGREPRSLSGMERVYLRNSYFYAGDCAMELKSYEGAIAAYDAARNKYADDPASLVAMAQIVSAYAAQEKWAEARTANERARQQLAKFPESVWQNPDLPMEKRHWERWLDARTLIGQQTAGAEKEEKTEH